MYKYCGPYWSEGKWQSSVAGSISSENQLDELCRLHDAVYAKHGDVDMADKQFYQQAFHHGPLGMLMSSAVWLNSGRRALELKFSNNMPPKLRKVAAKQQQRLKAGSRVIAAPVALGTVMRNIPPIMKRDGRSARIQGRELLTQVHCVNNSSFGVGCVVPLSPVYFQGGILANQSRSFEKYHWRKLGVTYVPRTPTSEEGLVVLTSCKSVIEPCLSPDVANFLTRAMAQGNAIMGPLWQQISIDIDCPNEWHLVDTLIHNDLDDCIHEELQVFSQAAFTGICGYLFIEYDIEFKEPIYQPHSTIIPVPIGPDFVSTLTTSSATPTTNDAVAFTNTTLTAQATGTVFRCVIDTLTSAAPTGTTLSNLFKTTTYRHSTVTAFASSTPTLPIVNGLTVWAVVNDSTLYVYSTLEGALNGSGTGQLFYNTTGSTTGTIVAHIYMVRLGVALQSTTQ